MFAVIGKIFENVAFFGDILLRMPDKTKQVQLLGVRYRVASIIDWECEREVL